MGVIRAKKEPVFEEIPLESYSLEIWTDIFQVIEAEALQTPMISPEGMKTEKGESHKPIDRTLPPTQPDPSKISLQVGYDMES